MNIRLTAGVLAGTILCLSFTIPANASCRDTGTCSRPVKTQSHAIRHKAITHKTSRHKTSTHKITSHKTTKHRSTRHKSRRKSAGNAHHPAASSKVISIITATAPSYGVPTWFALRIAKVESTMIVPSGVTVIDGAGKTLLPGLIDSHAHVWGTPFLEQAAVFGVTTVLDMGCADPQRGVRGDGGRLQASYDVADLLATGGAGAEAGSYETSLESANPSKFAPEPCTLDDPSTIV